MKIFVTGATGFLGRTIAPRLIDAGHDLTLLALPHEVVAETGVAVVRGDITDPGSLRGKLSGHDAVVHLAGAVGYGQTFARCNALNRDGTVNVAAAAVAEGVRRFVHMSSVSVYGRVPDVVLDEDAPLRKIGDPYGDTKIDAELALSALSPRGELDLTMVRPTVIYGPGDDKFLPKLVENLRAGGVRIVGTGDNTVDLVHVNDAADFVALLLARPESIGRTYNLASPGNPTWKEFLREVARLAGVAPPSGRLPYTVAYGLAGCMEAVASLRGSEPRLTRYAVRVVGRQYRYATERARRELGFEPRVDLFTGVAGCMAGYLAGCAKQEEAR
ncbi:MAG: NAD-dependent epimerase/dehydratase family protein [Deltaproteobacteria bacterium]|nr:NAD-dependent epimerase/dehydratase family protein [Deltaproteobacteria bacterium]